MRIRKTIQGVTVELELEKIRDYPRFSLYQVYKIVKGKRIEAYKKCYTQLQILDIIKKGYCISEEIFVW